MPTTTTEQTTDHIGVKPDRIKIQVLRGVASVAVLWNHVGSGGYLDPAFKLSGFFVPSGNMRPLLFFMLSGYLIGYSVKNRLVDWSSVSKFLRKRLKRLYPIYLLAVLATFAITYDRDPVASLLNHLVFLQGGSRGLFSENVSFWTMPFEIFFYVAFIPVSFFRVKPVVVATVSLLMGLALLLAQIDAPLVISYCFGTLFWSTGLVVAHAEWKASNYPTSYLLALLLLLLCYQHVEVGQYVINQIPFLSLPVTTDSIFHHHPVRLVYLEFLPLCALILAAFTNKKMPWARTLLWLVLLPPVARVIYLMYGKLGGQPSEMLWSIGFFFLSISFLLFPFRLRLSKLKKCFAFLGDISYGTYLIHAPIMLLFLRFEPFSGSATTAFVRLGLYLVTTFSVAYMLEKFRKTFFGNNTPKDAAASDLSMHGRANPGTRVSETVSWDGSMPLRQSSALVLKAGGEDLNSDGVSQQPIFTKQQAICLPQAKSRPTQVPGH